MAIKFFKIESRPIYPREWGDYGYTLQHGMVERISNGRLALERTGPYIPPISLPGIGEVVLTSEAKKLLERSSISGFSVATVEKVRIVELHCETWGLDSKHPAEYPESGEPEDYILGRPHSPTTSTALGELWEIVVPATLTIIRPESTVSSYRELKIDLSTWNGADLVRSNDYGSILFTERARDWFAEHWGKYVVFDQFPAA